MSEVLLRLLLLLLRKSLLLLGEIYYKILSKYCTTIALIQKITDDVNYDDDDVMCSFTNLGQSISDMI